MRGQLSKRNRFQRSVSIAVLSSMLLTMGTPFTTTPAAQAETLSSTEQSDPAVNQETSIPEVNHTPPEWISAMQPFTVTAAVHGGEPQPNVRLTYLVDGQGADSLELTPVDSSPETYTGEIPAQSLNGHQLSYTIELLNSEGKIISSSDFTTVIHPVIAAAKQTTGPSLLITEIVPDTSNLPNSSTDAYEFIEVYNNTDQEINFKDYFFYYNNKDTWKTDEGSDIFIPAHSPVVFWIMNGSNHQLTVEQFNSNFGTSLVEGQQIHRLQGGSGMANGSARSLVIKSLANDNETITSASYEPAQVKTNMGVFFKHPAVGSTQMNVMSDSGKLPATPGVIDSTQIVPPVVDEDSQTSIEHIAPTDALPVQDFVVKAKINNPAVEADGSPSAVKLLFKTPAQHRYTALTMSSINQTNEYSAVIPASMLVEPQLLYRIQNGSLDQSYTASVQLDAFDPSKVPPLLITELVPNTTNIPGTSTDAYEYVEIYNNTNQPVQFKNYSLYYRYPDKGPNADVLWQAEQPDFVIPPQQPVVFWIKNSANASYTEQDFNQFYQSSLIPNVTLHTIQSDGMANSGRRALVLKTNTGKEISSAYYDADQAYADGTKGDETKENKAITYAYPLNGSSVMIKSGSGSDAPSPGILDSSQIPPQPIQVEQDNLPPTVTDMTRTATVDQSKGLELVVDAKDNREVTSVEVYIRSDKDTEFSRYRLTEDFNDTMYHYNLSSASLIGRKTIEYYFVVSDGVHETRSDKTSISITGGVSDEALRLNVKDQDILQGTHILKGTSQSGNAPVQLRIDNKLVPENSTSGALEHDAYFVFEAVNVDYYFKNAVTMGPPELEDQTILYTFMNPITAYTTLSFPISSERLIQGDNVIYVRAGSKTSPFDQRPEENKDDFEIKNVRLLLADGTEIWDPAYAEKEKQIKMGDSAGKSESIGFHFNLKPEQMKSTAYTWDTTAVPDGHHLVKVTDGEKEAAAQVLVDNTGPVIQPTVEENQTYRGPFVIDAQIQDEIAGVDEITVKLDGKKIDLPMHTSSGKMSRGKHTLQIQAADRAGNLSDKTIQFHVPDENPLQPELISPQLNQTNVGTAANLIVKVQDPSADAMNVSFFKGYKYDSHRADRFTGYLNTAETEPPKQMIPAGEKVMEAADYRKIEAVDGTYLVNDSVEQFPYQRFEVKLDPDVRSTDRVDIQWQGKSLEGRKVSLYAWSEAQKKWAQLDQVSAGKDDFGLSAVVLAGDYSLNGTIQVMVQDELAEQQVNLAGTTSQPESQEDYDFSFIWMSDTQYYSQSYPQIYQKMVSWIAEQKEQMNIKYVIHTGDVVDKADQEYQWIEADKNMKVLEDASIPYGVLAGNHDVGHQDNDYSKFQQYFGAQRFVNQSVYGGSYENNRGHYDLVSAGGNDFIIVYMGWGLGEKEIDWMNEIVAKYPERKAILCLHEYLLVSNNRSPIADQIFEKVVKPNKNVIAALSGHYHDAELKVDAVDDDGDGIPDRSVYQMLADYQGAPEGGLGYMRLMQFDMKNNKLHIKTYSPYLNDYNYYDPAVEKGKDEFSLDLGLAPTTKRVATDYIGVNVYTDEKIGSQHNIPSGKQASVVWKGLASGSYNQWYVQVKDDNSGSTLSDIWGFHTGTPSPGENTPGNGGGDSSISNPEMSTGSSDSTPTESKTPIPPEKGKLVLKRGEDGIYRVESSLLEQAAESSADRKVMITLEDSDPNTETSFDLYLPGKAVKQAKANGKTIQIVSPGLQITLPPDVLPQFLEDEQQLILRSNRLQDANTAEALTDRLAAREHYVQTGIMQSLRMYILQGQKEREVQTFTNAVLVEKTLTADQLKKFHSEYAGVYLAAPDGQNVQYKGGAFNNSRVTFNVDQPGVYTIMEYRKSFGDIANSWAAPYVGMLTAKHLIQGINSENYGPELKVNRGDFITLMMRAAGKTSSTLSSPYADVPSEAYFGPAAAEAAALGIVQGNGGLFRPKDAISREEAAVILMRASEKLFNNPASASEMTKSTFTDHDQVSSWAKEAVEHVSMLGIMTGKANLRFDPKAEVTRAELAKMVYEFIHLQD